MNAVFELCSRLVCNFCACFGMTFNICISFVHARVFHETLGSQMKMKQLKGVLAAGFNFDPHFTALFWLILPVVASTRHCYAGNIQVKFSNQRSWRQTKQVHKNIQIGSLVTPMCEICVHLVQFSLTLLGNGLVFLNTSAGNGNELQSESERQSWCRTLEGITFRSDQFVLLSDFLQALRCVDNRHSEMHTNWFTLATVICSPIPTSKMLSGLLKKVAAQICPVRVSGEASAFVKHL